MYKVLTPNIKPPIYMYVHQSFPVGGAQLPSSVEWCPERRETLTCTVPSGGHAWSIMNGSTTQTIGTVLPQDPRDSGLGFELAVVDPTASPITSTASVTTATNLNGTVIVCTNGLLPPNSVEQNTTVNIIGEFITS